MGWCSGTTIFDKVAGFILDCDYSEVQKFAVIMCLIDALEDDDWDCQDDSRYIDNPIVQRAMLELHPTWYSETEDD